MSNKFDKYLATQHRLAEFGTLNSKLAETFASITRLYQQPILDIQRQLVSPKFPYYEKAAWVIEDMFKLKNSSLSPAFHKSMFSNDIQRQLKTIKGSLSSLTPILEMVTVHKNYVLVPESLIPDDFSYEEVADDSLYESDEITETTVPVKRLSFSDSLTIIQMLFGLLAWIISFIQTNQSSLEEQKNHNERIAIETERNMILQNGFEDIVKNLAPIYNKLEEIEDALPKNDSLAPSADYPASCAESSRPIEADEPDDSDMLHKAD